MTSRVYSDWIKAFVDTYDFIEPTEKLLFWAGVSSIASAVKHNVIVDQVSYKLPLNHYIIIVGGAGIRKSSAIMQMAQMTSKVRNELGIKYTAQSSSWQAIVDDLAACATLEPLWEPGVSYTHSYLTSILSEFGSMFKSDDAGMVDFLVDLWDLHTTWTKRARKDGEPIELQRPGLNILGGTTPSWIADNFRRSLAKGGLGSRVIWVYETKIKRLVTFVDEATPPNYQQTLTNLARDLVHIGSLKGVIQFSKESRDIMRSWYTSAHEALLEREEDNVEAGFVSRKQAHAFKLAAILSLARGDSLIVSERDMVDACKIIDSVIPDLAIIFKSFDVTRLGEHVAIVADKIEIAGHQGNEQKIFAMLGRRIANKRMFDEAIETLHMQGFIYIEGAPPSRKLTHVRNLSPQQKVSAMFTNCKYHLGK